MKKQNTTTRIWYDFKNAKVKEAALRYAFENKTSVQAMIEEAIKSKFPNLAKGIKPKIK